MARKTLTWKGKALTEKMRRAQKLGVNATMAKCVQDAKSNHTWQNQSGVLEGSIVIDVFARDFERGVEGVWGSRDVVYARIQELGGTIRPTRAAKLAIPQPGGGVAFVDSVTIPARPYLRPAADKNYPDLVMNIRRAFEQGGAGA